MKPKAAWYQEVAVHVMVREQEAVTQIIEKHDINAEATGLAMSLEADVEVAGINSNLTASRRDTTGEQESDMDATIDLATQENGNATGSVGIGSDADIGIAHPAPPTLPIPDAVNLLLPITPMPEHFSDIPCN